MSELPTRKKFRRHDDWIYYSKLARWYRRRLQTHPFSSFGLPFVALIVSGAFFLTPETAVRYERFDRKTHMLDREQELGLSERRQEARRKGSMKDRDMREEYWKLAGQVEKLDDWEPKRIQRLEGEPDGTFD